MPMQTTRPKRTSPVPSSPATDCRPRIDLCGTTGAGAAMAAGAATEMLGGTPRPFPVYASSMKRGEITPEKVAVLQQADAAPDEVHPCRVDSRLGRGRVHQRHVARGQRIDQVVDQHPCPQLVALSAGSARDLPGSTVSVRVAPEGAWALVTIADNIGGADAGIAGLSVAVAARAQRIVHMADGLLAG